MKEICVVFAGPSLDTEKASEKLRMTVGLTLNDDNAVRVLFLGGSRKAEPKGEIAKHVEMLAELKVPLFVEEGGGFSLLAEEKYKRIKRSQVEEFFDKADVVIN